MMLYLVLPWKMRLMRRMCLSVRGIKLGGDLGIDQRGLQAAALASASASGVQVQRQAVGHGAQGFHVHPVAQALDHAVGQ
jgi:hypothetical protein